MSVPDRSHGAAPLEALPTDAPRVRLVDVRAIRAQAGRTRVEVDLQTPDGRSVTGVHEEFPSATGDVRIGAEAALAALRLAQPAVPRLVLVGAKTVRAFDQTVTLVLISVSGHQGPARLLGAACNEENISRAAVLAVLNATNRLRGPWAADQAAGDVAGEQGH